MNLLTRRAQQNRNSYLFLTAVASFLCAAAVFVPFLVTNGGWLTVVDDFNSQQVPFNMYVNDALKQGKTWAAELDIGSGLIPAFSFYNLGSPFFWLSMLFPSSFFPYLTGPLYILKYMTAAIFAYLYLQRFVRDRRTAVVGAMLYAFSGFQAANTIFNHFHDVTAFFPLLLITLEELATRKRRGVFALAVGFSCVLNYFFFAEEVVFVVIYYIVRFLIPHWSREIRRVWEYLLEGLLGVGLGSFLFIPSMLSTMELPRAQAKLSFDRWFFYSKEQYLNLLRSFLFPGDFMPSEVIYPPTYYASTSLWLPAVGIMLVLVFFLHKKTTEDKWLRNLLLVLALFAGIPVLNSVFTGLGSVYYTRWFFMPILIMALASAKALDFLASADQANPRLIRLASGITLILLIGFTILCFILPSPRADRTQIGVINHVPAFLAFSLASILGLLLAWLILDAEKKERPERRFTALLAIVLVFGGLNQVYTIARGQNSGSSNKPENVPRIYVGFGNLLNDLAKDAHLNLDLYRFHSDTTHRNEALTSGLRSINSFSSTVSPSIYQFYNDIGQGRFVASVNDEPGLRSFLGARYLVSPEPQKGQGELLRQGVGEDGATAYIYEYDSYLPAGFSYQYYISWEDFQKTPFPERSYLIHRALPLKPEQEALASSLGLRVLPEDQRDNLTAATMPSDDSKLQGVSEMTWQGDGFRAGYTRTSQGNLFFTVPWSSGWTCLIDGKEVAINESMGLMFIEAPAGSHEVAFTYRTPGLTEGMIITCISVIALVVYLYLARRKERPQTYTVSERAKDDPTL